MHPRHGVTATVTELGAATLVWPPLCLCSCAVCLTSSREALQGWGRAAARVLLAERSGDVFIAGHIA